MDNSEMILTGAVSPPMLLEHLGPALYCRPPADSDTNAVRKLSEQKKIQAAKDFESVFIAKLLDQMKDTIGDWGFESDAVSQQVQGIFWLYLARDVANKGGFGLWKDIYASLTASDSTSATQSSG